MCRAAESTKVAPRSSDVVYVARDEIDVISGSEAHGAGEVVRCPLDIAMSGNVGADTEALYNFIYDRFL